MTSIDGFADGSQVFTSHHSYDLGTNLEFVFTLPDTAAYGPVSGPVELRLYGYSGQYGGHRTSLLAFKLKGQVIAVCSGDHDGDFDVDGGDLATQAAGNEGIDLTDFAEQFGRTNCD